MITALIIEDEKIAAERLQKLILKLRPDWKFLKRADSIETAVETLETHKPDVIFIDVQLSDGVSFEIFNQVQVEVPLIFTTAYNEYALKAFKVNSVDYLLKPVDEGELEGAIAQFEKTNSNSTQADVKLDATVLNNLLTTMTKNYKERFVIKIGEHIKVVNTEDVLYFFSQDKITYLVAKDGRKYILEFALDKLEEMVDPNLFFRISRKYIVRGSAIKDIIAYTNSRLRLILEHGNDQDVIVARERVQDFKGWLDQ